MSQELNMPNMPNIPNMPKIPNIPRFQSLNFQMEIQMSGASPNVSRVENPEYAEYPEISISEYPYGNSNVLGHLPMSQELNMPNIPNMPNILRFQSLNIHMEVQMSRGISQCLKS